MPDTDKIKEVLMLEGLVIYERVIVAASRKEFDEPSPITMLLLLMNGLMSRRTIDNLSVYIRSGMVY